eukprot:TRINITY_DN1619_c0_g1_i2.p1 TRINITY_DN1619_c0_g1~~TRINITY_DN1619_c0_g1_i2.p1  ORF type:complete len:165 (-),score=29.15 TRINITY_DN1619_c0_g1_i2:515-1009(-)
MCIRDRWYQRRVRGPKKSGMETMTNSSLIEMAALDDVDAYDMVEFSEVEGDGCVLTDKLLLLVLSHWDPQTLSRSALVCRRFRRISDSHPTWRAALEEMGASVEVATLEDEAPAEQASEQAPELQLSPQDCKRIYCALHVAPDGTDEAQPLGEQVRWSAELWQT